MYVEIVKPPTAKLHSLNIVVCFGCQSDEPYSFPDDHLQNAAKLQRAYWHFKYNALLLTYYNQYTLPSLFWYGLKYVCSMDDKAS